jgi:hypothetical protein
VRRDGRLVLGGALGGLVFLLEADYRGNRVRNRPFAADLRRLLGRILGTVRRSPGLEPRSPEPPWALVSILARAEPELVRGLEHAAHPRGTIQKPASSPPSFAPPQRIRAPDEPRAGLTADVRPASSLERPEMPRGL